jgi:hypothetical protein
MKKLKKGCSEMVTLYSNENGFPFYICDTEDDRLALPTYRTPDANGKTTSYCSMALVVETGIAYVLRRDTDEWAPI